MKMKRKGKNTNKDRQILDNDEHLDTSTKHSDVIVTSSNDNNRILSTYNNISSPSSNDNSRILSTSNNSSSSSINNNNRTSSTTNDNNRTSSTTNDNNRVLSTSNSNISSSSFLTNNNSRILSTSNNNISSPSTNNSRTLSTFNNNVFSPSSNNNNSALLSTNISPAPSSINNNPSSSSNNNNLIGRKSSSNAWRYAKKSDDGKTAICLLCDYSCVITSHSTSTIRYHLIHQHNKHDLIGNSSSSSSSTKPHVSEQFKRDLHTLCYNAIVIDHRPFNDLRKQGILAIFNKLCPGYTPPHRNQISNQLKHLYNHHFQLLKDELKEVDYIGLTLDFWSSRSSVSYLCITGHYYKDHMEFNSKIIHFSSFNERHTAVNIARCLKENLTALDIYDKITAITCDGGQNLVAACKKLDGFIKRIWCCTHRLHLVVVNALGLWNKEKKADGDQTNYSSTEIPTATEAPTSTETTASTITVSDVISKNHEESMDTSWFSEHEQDDSLFDETNDDASENDVMTFDNDDGGNESEGEANILADDEVMNETQNLGLIDDNWSKDIETDVAATEEVELIMKLLKKCRTIATVTKKSSIISNFIRSHKLLYNINKTINIDCKSRWNSTYTLIDAIIDIKPLLMKLFVEKRTLKLRKEQFEKLTTIELHNEDWDFLSSLHHVLKPFFLGTVMMSGKNYPSIGLAYHTIQKIKQFCADDNNNNEHIKELKKMLLAKIYKYFFYDLEQLEYFQCHAFFDPVAHLSLGDVEKNQCEKYIKHLIFNDVYPQKRPTFDVTQTSSSSAAVTMSSTTPTQLQHSSSQNNSLKSSTYDDFLSACGDQGSLLESSKEKSKRICLNEELKYFKAAVQEFNLKTKPSTASVLNFWKMHYVQLPLLSNLAKVHLVACGSSVPSESAFSCSAYVARKERSRLSPENLCFSVFLKDKLGKK